MPISLPTCKPTWLVPCGFSTFVGPSTFGGLSLFLQGVRFMGFPSRFRRLRRRPVLPLLPMGSPSLPLKGISRCMNIFMVLNIGCYGLPTHTGHFRQPSRTRGWSLPFYVVRWLANRLRCGEMDRLFAITYTLTMLLRRWSLRRFTMARHEFSISAAARGALC